ncbi:tetratricopeptide repeat protein [Parablautia intestinalis]|jgi:tetratricopeptide (TPR) repeat protein|uniref:Tetratricopeptide repeat protein n=1 Tax=Parablautia intestinalis TaxID=2320100 RepID=A0A3A9AQN6_9FIRM|nr:tetratricopeptide repeat protein [Parablautia intestinalis]MCI8614626.1 tetratricopeptide repeat protein [Lachnospiraceae bacterium]RKI89891.1 tetratricopeptide repeat protein [Parablautia intestinalis]
MICYNCGCRLSEHDFCTGCGVDVSLYKRIMFTSNRFYNDGLEKAMVRDLSGAIVSLRQSLKLNKNNIDARNLLGLVYFEMGEVVAALSEWVISKNLRPKKNIADDYIDMVQTNQSRLDTINQTIKKYNQALQYCYQSSEDLAVIQLKKVLSYNPKYVCAHQLLALLYIQTEEWEKAYRELQKCCQIDTNNTITLRYMKEVEHMLSPEEGSKGTPRKKASSEKIVRYQSGNETIIQPVNAKEHKGVSSLLNLGLGVIIGVAIACFLILPGRIQSAKAVVNKELRAVSEQSDAKTATIDELEQKVQKLTDEKDLLSEELAAYQGTDGTLQATDGLMMAVSAYLQAPDDIKAIADYLETLDEEGEEAEEYKTDAFTSLYESLVATVGPKLEEYYYNIGYSSFRSEDYATAIPNLEKAYLYNNTNGDALFYLGESYFYTEDYDKAKKIFAQVIDDYPGTRKASSSETHLAEINNAG